MNAELSKEMKHNFYVYKAIDADQCSALVAAWIQASPVLYRYTLDNPQYSQFMDTMLKLITRSEPEEIVRVFSPGVYESLLIPSHIREEICGLWRVLYQNLPIHAAETETVKKLAAIINTLRIPPENITGKEA